MSNEQTTVYGLTFSSTPRHGYLEVPTFLLERVGFTPTRFSVRMSGYYFLEEDCDAPDFLKLADAHGIQYRITEYERDEAYEQMIDSWF